MISLRLSRPQASYRRLGTTALRVAAEIALAVAAYILYSFARDSAYDRGAADAFVNAIRVVNFETAIGIFKEAVVQQWLLENARGVVYLFNWFYIVGYMPILLVVGVVLYRRDRKLYTKYRAIAFISFFIAVVMYTLYPLAPPRMLPNLGFVDTFGVLGPYEYHTSNGARFYNPHAAMPSMHFALVVLIAVIALRHSGLLWKALSVSYVVLMLFAIVVTGNHYLVDASAAVGVIGLSFIIYHAVVVPLSRKSGSVVSRSAFVKRRKVNVLGV